MPLYEYECFLCGDRFERIQRVSDDPVSECPSCGGSVRRLLGVPALQFKGSGWYVTDYGKGNGGRPPGSEETKEKAAASTESKTTKKETGDSSGKSDSKAT